MTPSAGRSNVSKFLRQNSQGESPPFFSPDNVTYMSVTPEVVESIIESYCSRMKKERELDGHIADIKREKEAASGLKPFNVEDFLERTESAEFRRSLESILACRAPALKCIRYVCNGVYNIAKCNFQVLLFLEILW